MRKIKQISPHRNKLQRPPSPGMVGDVMNSSRVDASRFIFDDDTYHIHVSDLIRSKPDEVFCPREKALTFFEKKNENIRTVSPGFSLLFAMGHTIHDHITSTFADNKEFGALLWGRWACLCGKTTRTGYRPLPGAYICNDCGSPPRSYAEYKIRNDKYKIIGHPDFLIKWAKRITVYETKSIDRKDIIFDELKHPLGDHVLQASFYNWMLGEAGFEVDPILRFIYVDRGSKANSKLFWGKPYKELSKRTSKFSRLKPFLDKAEALSNSVKNKKLPPRICPTISCARAKNCKSAVSCFSRNSNQI